MSDVEQKAAKNQEAQLAAIQANEYRVPSYACDQCPAAFRYFDEYERHMRVHGISRDKLRAAHPKERVPMALRGKKT